MSKERMLPKSVYIRLDQMLWMDDNVENHSEFIRKAIDLMIEQREKEKEGE